MRYLIIFSILNFSILYANLGNVDIGARAIATGRACAPLVEGSEAIFWNPASIISDKKFDLFSVYEMPYSIKDLMRGAIAVKMGDNGRAFGAGLWVKNLSNAFTESHIILGFARKIHFIKGGCNLRYILLSVKDGDGNIYTERNWTVDVGILIEIKDIKMSYSYFDLLNPNLSLLGNKEPSISTKRIGLGFRRPSNVTWLFSVEDHGEGFDIYRIGVEAWFTHGFAARFGIDERYPTIGFGLKEKKWGIDFGTRSHRYLGNTYSVAFKVFGL